jgi:hypothetical protein
MAQAGVLKEFLVKLGVDVDESALKKLSDGVTNATKAVVGLATAIEGTAVAVSVAVSRFASNLEALYFASQRTGASASNLKAFSLAAQNFGASAEEAAGSIEGLASFLRNNPAGEGFLRGLGLQTRDPKTGKVRDTVDMIAEFGRATARMPFYLAKQYGDILGISERTLLALRNGEFQAELDKREKQLANVGFKKATEDSHRFMESLRDAVPFIEQFGVRVYDAIANKLGFTIETLTSWLQRNGPALADRIADALVKLIGYAEKLIDWAEKAIAKFKEWDDATGGWLGNLVLVGAALKFLGGAEILGAIAALAAALGPVGLTIAGIVAGVAWLNEHAPNNWFARIGNAIGGKMYESAHRYEDAVRQFENMGWTHAQASGIVANLGAENALLDPTSAHVDTDNQIHRGIAQWSPERWGRLEKWAAANRLDPSAFSTQVQYIGAELRSPDYSQAYALLQASRNDPFQSGYNFSRYYERPAGGDDTAARRGAAAVTLSQKTDIHVTGTGDPLATAHAVASEQRRVNEEMIHNFAPAIQ